MICASVVMQHFWMGASLENANMQLKPTCDIITATILTSLNLSQIYLFLETLGL